MACTDAPIRAKSALDKREREESIERPSKASKVIELWPAAYKAPNFKPARSANWRSALFNPADGLFFACNDDVRVIYDAYPKAKYHLLALAPPGSELRAIRLLADLRPRHLSALQRFHASIRSCAESLLQSLGCELRIGYHAKQSLDWLHCHIVSTDFESECLKTYHHWLSFTTDFLVSIDSLENTLASDDSQGSALAKDLARRTNLISTAVLACHKCGRRQPNVPALKRHIAKCPATCKLRTYSPEISQ